MNDPFVLHVLEHTLPTALDLLPGRMDSLEAKAMLIAIGLQESRFKHRRQVGPGPARGFWQFEKLGGVKGVLTHEMSSPLVRPICDVLRYTPTPDTCHVAIEHNDTLACVFARLLLYTHPAALPREHETSKGWDQYIASWRPGKPHPATWSDFYRQAWTLVKGEG